MTVIRRMKYKLKQIKWFLQRHFRGWSDDECWDLYFHIAKRYLPALKRFRKNHAGYPGYLTSKQWNVILDKIIYAFEFIVKDNFAYNKKVNEKVQEGCELFGKHFQNLWD
jgi:hypothetical protein